MIVRCSSLPVGELHGAKRTHREKPCEEKGRDGLCRRGSYEQRQEAQRSSGRERDMTLVVSLEGRRE